MQIQDYVNPLATLLESRPIKNTEYLSVVLCKMKDRSEYVTWIFNHDMGGCIGGHYFDKLSDAVADFEKRN